MTVPFNDQTLFATWPTVLPQPLAGGLAVAADVPLVPLPSNLKSSIIGGIWNVVDKFPWIVSATFTGSFLTTDDLQAISDIDLVLVVSHLDRDRFETLQHACKNELQPILKRHGFDLNINPTLGPLKLNDQNTAVLHLMLYSRAAHVEHVLKSPFTCFDWQRSSTFRKQSLADVYPVFALQPHHFVSARRSVSEYLKDFRSGIVSYRELICNEQGYEERRAEQPMTLRGRHEFAYHILRFLMQNLLKLVQRNNETPDGTLLADTFLRIFPLDADDVRKLYAELVAKKQSADFTWPVPDLNRRLEVFVTNFESQFRRMFITEATRHIVFRHASTELNYSAAGERRFVGRSNPEIAVVNDAALENLLAALRDEKIAAAYVSPLLRCQQSHEAVAARLPVPEPALDERLMEIDYGRCEGQSTSVARKSHPELFAAWARGEDRAFPGGESTSDVANRALGFANSCWPTARGATMACTHNVVLRTLVGHSLCVPPHLWHRLQIPHLQPITFVQTKQHGWFADLDEHTERHVFSQFSIGEG
jgi:ribonuclease H / adenosylcobalamin/alpha-ribazole phosphatase